MKYQNSAKGNSGMKFKFKKKRKKLRQLIKNEFDQDQNQELGLDKYQEEEPKQYYHESWEEDENENKNENENEYESEHSIEDEQDDLDLTDTKTSNFQGSANVKDYLISKNVIDHFKGMFGGLKTEKIILQIINTNSDFIAWSYQDKWKEIITFQHVSSWYGDLIIHYPMLLVDFCKYIQVRRAIATC